MDEVSITQQVAGLFEAMERFVPKWNIELPPWEEVQALAGNLGPSGLLILFTAASFLMVWRLDAIERNGFEGTIIGTLVMPFCSGFANLSFVFVMVSDKGGGNLVVENCIVNNVTNLTLVIGIQVVFWGLNITGNRERSKKNPESTINHISLLLSLGAMLFFTLTVWLLARDGILDSSDGMVLTGLFLFWQAFHVVDVIKNNVRKNRTVSPGVAVDFILVGLCAWVTFYTIDGLVEWVATRDASRFISVKNLGLLSGFLMVVPNALLAFYYSAKGRPDIAYSSQIGDCHICIPLCIGISAIFSPIAIPPTFEMGASIIMGAGILLFICTALLGRLPRIMGAGLALSYSIFLYRGILG
ncbi:MAG: hypothetical protein RBR67_05225 [Desulfobacterium sp.]|jgi:cation:H+ antiporter|nr:hypothetical protein [Desulfobacterium sp.]